MLSLILATIACGIGATALLDLWAILLNKTAGLALPDWALVGRWFGHLPAGKVFHDDIGLAEPVPDELALGWIMHYGVGILFAAILVAIAGPGWLRAPTFIPAWILGIATVGCGWFILQPGMGAGWAASKRPDAMKIRILNLAGHTVFAAGLYGTALLVK